MCIRGCVNDCSMSVRVACMYQKQRDRRSDPYRARNLSLFARRRSTTCDIYTYSRNILFLSLYASSKKYTRICTHTYTHAHAYTHAHTYLRIGNIHGFLRAHSRIQPKFRDTRASSFVVERLRSLSRDATLVIN